MNNSPPARHLCKLTALAVTVSSRQASQQQVDGAPGPASATGLFSMPAYRPQSLGYNSRGGVSGTKFGESND